MTVYLTDTLYDETEIVETFVGEYIYGKVFLSPDEPVSIQYRFVVRKDAEGRVNSVAYEERSRDAAGDLTWAQANVPAPVLASLLGYDSTEYNYLGRRDNEEISPIVEN